jgi:hypothetical protein
MEPKDKEEPDSPRARLLQKKFKDFDCRENVLENYACAAHLKILLQGMLYVTDRCAYFYSPFNNKTVVGHGTKVRIPYLAIKEIKKESSLVVFPNAIRFMLKSGH